MRRTWRILYWIITIPYALTIAFFAMAIPYCIVNFIRGGLPWVKAWLIHIQIEGCADCWTKDYWPWPLVLRPILLAGGLALALWTARRLLRRRSQDEPAT